MNQFDPVSNPYTTLPLLFTASPVQDNNTGWLGQYGTRFHYPTVIEFFKYLAVAGLFNLKEAGRASYFGHYADDGWWSMSLEEKYAYTSVPLLKMEAGGNLQQFPSTTCADKSQIVQHTLDWLKEAYDWFIANTPSGVVFPTWSGFIADPEPVLTSPPGDVEDS